MGQHSRCLHAFRYKNGQLTRLDASDSDQSVAVAINDAGQIVGNILNPITNGFSASYTIVQAFVYDRGRLKPLEPGTNSAAGINNQGQIVGGYQTSGGPSHAFVYRHGLMTDLGTLGGSSSGAEAINNRGDIVGGSDLTSSYTPLHPFLYRTV